MKRLMRRRAGYISGIATAAVVATGCKLDPRGFTGSAGVTESQFCQQ